METTAEIFRQLTGAKSVRAIASKAGLDASTTNRQLNGTTTLTVETVVDICRAYKLNFADTFAAVGFISEEEAAAMRPNNPLDAYSDLELAQEIVRRVAAGTASDDLTEPLPTDETANVIVGGFGNNVDAVDEIPENVEEEWFGQYAASPKSDIPKDHTP